MPGRLRFDALDVNDTFLVRHLRGALSSLARDPRNKHALEVRKRYYFATPNGPITSDAGWYAICDDSGPLYVGTAQNLNSRLNSENGSRDQFANPRRRSDPERNFIKALTNSGALKGLTVVVISEPALCSAMDAKAPLTRRDRYNVEKVLNLFRERTIRGKRRCA